MDFLKALNRLEAAPRIDAELVYLRGPRMSDFAEWAELRDASREFLTPWEPVWPSDDLTKPAFRRRLRRYMQDVREERAYPFFIFRQSDEALVGGCTLSNIRRGVQQSSTLGYWVGQRFANQGYVTSAVRAVQHFVFKELKLWRLEAACLPENEPSKKVLRRCGFQEEGISRGYLRINGAWRDHLRFAKLASDPST